LDYQFSDSDSQKYKELLEQTGKEKAAYDLFLKWKCLTDLYFLGSEILGLKNEHRNKKPLLDPKFHRWLAYVLSLEDDKLILVARGHLKSRWVKVRIIQDVLANPNIRIGLYSITNEKAQSMLDDIKRGFATPLLIRLFPETIPMPGKRYASWQKCNANELTIKRDLDMGNPPEENQIEAYGVGSTITGKHFDRHYYDDIVDKDTVRTMSQIQKTRDWFSYSQAILEPGGSETVTGTFYHYADLYNTAIKEEWYKGHVYIRPCRENNVPVYSWFTNAALDKIKRKSGPYIWSCNPGYAPIWMADMSFKNIEDVQIGDEVVGYEINAGAGRRRKLIKTKVISKNSRIAQTYVYNLSNGDHVICTEDHKWFTGRSDKTRIPYLTAKLGRYLKKFCSPTNKYLDEYEIGLWQYLSGIIDGEGSCKDGSITISQSKEKNLEVYAKIENTLDQLCINYSIKKDNRIYKKGATTFVINGGRDEKLKILNYCKPAKSDQIRKLLWRYNGMKSPNNEAKVIEIIPKRNEIVYALGTESGNYVVWGYASKNCQYELNPVPREDLIFPPPHPMYKEIPGEKEDYTWYIAVDPAPTQHEHSDSIALVCAALDKKGTVWIEEANQFKLPGADLARILIQKHLKYKSIRIGVEFGLQQDLKYILENEKSKYEETTHKPLGWYIDEIRLTKQNKLERINWSFGSFVRSGKCFIKEDCYDLLRQMELITPNYEGHDDLVDACSMIFPLVDSYSFRYYTKPPQERGEIQLKTWWTVDELYPKKLVVGFEDRFVKGNT